MELRQLCGSLLLLVVYGQMLACPVTANGCIDWESAELSADVGTSVSEKKKSNWVFFKSSA